MFTLILHHKTILRRNNKPLTRSRAQPHVQAVYTIKRASVFKIRAAFRCEVHILHLYIHRIPNHRHSDSAEHLLEKQTGETAHFKCTSNKIMSLSALQRNEASESPCKLLQPFQTLWKIILQKVQVAHAREELEASSIWVFLKQLCVIAHLVKI